MTELTDPMAPEMPRLRAPAMPDAADWSEEDWRQFEHDQGDVGEVPQPPPEVEAEWAEASASGPAESEHPLQLLHLEAATRTTDEVKALAPREPLIADILDLESLACTYGASGAGKTFVTLGQALSIASDRPWHGHDVTAGPVIYVVAEGAAGLGARITAWEQHHGVTAYDHAVHWVTRAVNLFERAWVDAFVEYAATRRPVAVFFDTLARCTVGADESSARDMGVVVDNLDRIKRATGACVNVVHHTGKDQAQGARGSSALRAGVDTELEVKGTDNRVTIAVSKQKDAAEAEPLQLERQVVGASCVLAAGSGRLSLSGKALDTLAALRRIELPGGVSTKEWRIAADVPERTFYDHRKLLVDCAAVQNVGTDRMARYMTAAAEEEF